MNCMLNKQLCLMLFSTENDSTKYDVNDNNNNNININNQDNSLVKIIQMLQNKYNNLLTKFIVDHNTQQTSTIYSSFFVIQVFDYSCVYHAHYLSPSFYYPSFYLYDIHNMYLL